MSQTETSILLQGPAGLIETIIHEPVNTFDYLGIILHPHPLHGGTMNNKVVTTLAKTFRELNIINIKFNFRGVGKSEGIHDNGIGETEDTLFIIKWAQEKWPHKKIILSGFSFGSYVALRVASLYPINQLITVAPAVNKADFSGLDPHCPWLIIVADQDEIVPSNEIYEWIKTLNPPPDVTSFPDANHFFDGQLIALKENLLEKLRYAHSL
jgi:alpha/beta superfamily hydrolase